MSLLGLRSAAAAASIIVLSAAPSHTDLDGGPIYVGSGGSPVIHRRGRFKPNQRKQRRGQRA